ncbi:DUF4249 domain-containing protein [Ulvibacterium marinum]|uniref:DUF4249 domain-containing protein n=1 Tax=Ulvibacterium marinum TaxID=2419782 RepID=UPI0024946BB6|nr:DUF4249 domain-containing protein [Ulvibacterium marinum]
MSRELPKYSQMIFTFLWACIILEGCTEPFSPDIPFSDSLLVVDATITNELKTHEIFLSRSSQGNEESQVESNATVRIVDDSQRQFPFTETEPGTYVSDVMFEAEPDRSYRLLISTASGREYASSPTVLPPQTAEITDVYADRTTTDSGLDGMGIFVNSFDPTGNSIYYKYEYEETYKIIAPKWSPSQLVAGSEESQSVLVVGRDPDNEERTCFATEKSNTLVITNTSGVGEDRVTDFNVRFINRDNFIISHRYSLLVKQFVLSREVFEFYEKLQDFSGVESLFSDSQPGFIVGNISPQDNGEDEVVGIFEVSSVSEKRVFFNYSDFFPDEDLPPFVNECGQVTFPSGFTPTLYDLVKSNRVSYTNEVRNELGALEAYIVVPRICGDCTLLGSNVIPDFWKE